MVGPLRDPQTIVLLGRDHFLEQLDDTDFPLLGQWQLPFCNGDLLRDVTVKLDWQLWRL